MGKALKALSKAGNVAKSVGKKVGSAGNKATETALGSDGKSLFFLILSFVCIWLILDMFYGNKIIKQLVDSIFSGSDSSMGSDNSQVKADVSDSTKATSSNSKASSSSIDKSNSTVSGATSNKSFPYQTGDEQRKDAIKEQSKNNTTGSAGNFSASFPILNNNTVSGKGTTTGGNSGNFPTN